MTVGLGMQLRSRPMPAIAVYTIGVYWVFRGKVRTGQG
jgi:hypothetical protein